MDECISDLYIFIRQTMEINNLISIPLLGSMTRSTSQQVQQNKPIVHTSDELKCIRDNVYHDQCYRILSGEACQSIRSLRINKRRKRGSKAGLKTKSTELCRSVNLSNLIKVYINSLPHNQADQKTIRLSIINVQSIKNKDLIPHHYICNNKIDLCILTDTWLTDSNTEKIWKSCTSLNDECLKMNTSNRLGQQGGGLALVYSNMLNVTKVDEVNKKTFQLAIWKVSCKAYTIMIIVSITHHTQLQISVQMPCF